MVGARVPCVVAAATSLFQEGRGRGREFSTKEEALSFLCYASLCRQEFLNGMSVGFLFFWSRRRWDGAKVEVMLRPRQGSVHLLLPIGAHLFRRQIWGCSRLMLRFSPKEDSIVSASTADTMQPPSGCHCHSLCPATATATAPLHRPTVGARTEPSVNVFPPSTPCSPNSKPLSSL